MRVYTAVPTKFGSFGFMLDGLHPLLRADIEAEVARINIETPPLEGNEVMGFVKHAYRMEDKEKLNPIDGYGSTKANLGDAPMCIFLNPDCFGPDAKVERTRELIEMDKSREFHGSMTNPGFVLAHEYGHITKTMIEKLLYRKVDGSWDEETGWTLRILRDGEEPGLDPILKAYKELMDIGQKGKNFGLKDTLRQMLGVPKTSKTRLQDFFPTIYSMESADEFFAEVYAIRCYGNAEEKQKKAVVAMDALLKLVYESRSNQIG